MLTLCHLGELRMVGVVEVKHGAGDSYYKNFFNQGKPRLPPVARAQEALMDIRFEQEDSDDGGEAGGYDSGGNDDGGGAPPGQPLQVLENVAPRPPPLDPLAVSGNEHDPSGHHRGSVAGRSRRQKDDGVASTYVDPATGQSFGFTFRFGDQSWQSRCLAHEPSVNQRGSKTYCTKTIKVPAGLEDGEKKVLDVLQAWCRSAGDFTSRQQHMASLGRRRVLEEMAVVQPLRRRAKRRRVAPPEAVVEEAAVADDAANADGSDSSSKGAVASSSSCDSSSKEDSSESDGRDSD